MTLTLDNGQVLELTKTDSTIFNTYEVQEPLVKDMGGLIEFVRPSLCSSPIGDGSHRLVRYPSLRIGSQYFAYKLKK